MNRIRTSLRWAWPVAAGMLLVAIACESLEWPFLRAPLERLLASRLDGTVQIGPEFGLRVFGSLRLRSSTIVIAKDTPALQWSGRARGLRASVGWPALLALASGRSPAEVTIESLQLEELDITVRRTASAAPAADAAPLPLPRFEHLVVASGSVALDDDAGDTQVRLRFATSEGHPAAGAPGDGLQLTAEGRWRGQQFRAEARADGLLPLVDRRPGAAPVAFTATLSAGATRVELDGSAAALLGPESLTARARTAGPSLAAAGSTLGLSLPSTRAYALDATVTLDGARWSAEVARLSVGASTLSGRFLYDTATRNLTGTLNGTRLDLPDLGPAFAGTGPPDRAVPRAAGSRVLPQRELDLSALRSMHVDLDVALDTVRLGTAKLDVLAPLRGRLRLEDGVLRLDDMAAEAAGGRLSGALRLDARPAVPLWQAQLRWSGIGLDRFVRERTDTAAGTRGRPVVSGTLTGSAELRGRGRSTAAMLASLEGRAQAAVHDGTLSHLVVELAGIDLAESLGLLVSGDRPLPLRCAVFVADIAQGEVRPRIGVVDTDDTTLLLGGSLSLRDETLAISMAARPKDISPITLRSPVRIEGTFDRPAVRLDRTAIGLRVAAAAALAMLAPAAGLLALIDLGEDQRNACTEAMRQVGRPAARRP